MTQHCLITKELGRVVTGKIVMDLAFRRWLALLAKCFDCYLAFRMQLILVYFACFFFSICIFLLCFYFCLVTLFSLFLSVAHSLGTNSFSPQPTAGVKIKDGSYDLCRENSEHLVAKITPFMPCRLWSLSRSPPHSWLFGSVVSVQVLLVERLLYFQVMWKQGFSV